jgi:ligand-binding sensor domain-containing protein
MSITVYMPIVFWAVLLFASVLNLSAQVSPGVGAARLTIDPSHRAPLPPSTEVREMAAFEEGMWFLAFDHSGSSAKPVVYHWSSDGVRVVRLVTEKPAPMVSNLILDAAGRAYVIVDGLVYSSDNDEFHLYEPLCDVKLKGLAGRHTFWGIGQRGAVYFLPELALSSRSKTFTVDGDVRAWTIASSGQLWMSVSSAEGSKVYVAAPRDEQPRPAGPQLSRAAFDVTALFTDHSDRLWIAYSDGAVARYEAGKLESMGSIQAPVSAFLEDDAGTCYLLTATQHAGDNPAFTTLSVDGDKTFRETSLAGLDGQTRAMAFDSGNGVWISVGKQGAFRLQSLDNLPWQHTSRNGSPVPRVRTAVATPLAADLSPQPRLVPNVAPAFLDAKFTVLNSSHGLTHDVVTCITGDASGNVYYGTGYRDFGGLGYVQGGGVSRFDHRHFTNLTTSDGLPSNTVQACVFDPTNNVVWFGTDNGISRNIPGTSTFTNYLPGAVVRDLRLDGSGGLWVATFNQGFHRLNRANGAVTATYNTGNGLTSNAGSSVAIEASGVVWLGTEGGGLYRLPASGGPSRVPFGTDSNFVYDLEADASGNLWIAVRYQGVWRRTPAGTFAQFNASSNPPVGNSFNVIETIYRDQSNNLWFGLAYGGEAASPKVAVTFLLASEVNSATPQFQNYNAANNKFPNNVIISFWSENPSTMYFGSPGGGTMRLGGPGDAPGWPQPLSGYVYFSSPELADLDGNGDLEVIVGDVSGRVTAFRPNGSLLWSYDTRNAIPAGQNPGQMSVQSSPAVADVDGDGDPEVVVGVNGLALDGRPPGYGGVVILSKTGTLKRFMSTMDIYGYNYRPPDGFPEGVFTTPVLANLDADPEPEIFAGGLDNRFYGWNGDGSPVFNGPATDPGDPTPTAWPFFTNDSIVSSPVVGDLNRNGSPAVIFGQDYSGGYDHRSGNTFSRGGVLRVLGLNGRHLPGFPKGNLEQTIGSSPVLVDLDNDGFYEILHGSGGDLSTVGNSPQEQIIGQLVYAWRRDGSSFKPNASGKFADTLSRALGSFAVGDLDNDGSPELVIATSILRNISGQLLDANGYPTNEAGAVGQMVHVFRTDGSPMPGFPVRPHPRLPGANLVGSITLADIDGDNYLDILVAVIGGIVALDHHGRGISGMGMFGNLQDPSDRNEITCTPAVGDIDLDGRLELVYVMGAGDGSTGIVRVLKMGPVNNTVQRSWPMWRRNPQRNAVFDLQFGQVSASESGSNLVIRAQVFAGRHTITSVTADLASAGLGTVTLNDSGSAGDQRANDGYFTVLLPSTAPFGRHRLVVTATDAGGRSAVQSFYYVRKSPAKLLSVEPPTIDFGSAGANQTEARQVNVMNTSNAVMTLSGLSSSNAEFRVVSGGPFHRALAPGEVVLLNIGFTPTGTTGARTATLNIQSDDAAAASRTISLSGIGLGGAACSTSLGVTAVSTGENGQTGTLTVTAPAGCSWTASSGVSWAQVYPLSGTGTATLGYTIFPNFTPHSRSGAISVNSTTLSTSQSGGTGTANQRLVRLLYFNYFGRLPSQAEVDYQVNNALNVGASRTDLSLNFFSSGEFAAGGRFVAGVYVGLLNRDAEYGGWLFQRNALAQGIINQNSLVSNFLTSAEYQQRFGSPDNAEFVRLLYRYILLREATAAEVAFQAGGLAGGISRAQLASNFLNSTEFRVGTGPRLTAFLLFATLLQREISASEFQNYSSRVAGGTPVRDLLDEIVNSAEFVNALN